MTAPLLPPGPAPAPSPSTDLVVRPDRPSFDRALDRAERSAARRNEHSHRRDRRDRAEREDAAPVDEPDRTPMSRADRAENGPDEVAVDEVDRAAEVRDGDEPMAEGAPDPMETQTAAASASTTDPPPVVSSSTPTAEATGEAEDLATMLDLPTEHGAASAPAADEVIEAAVAPAADGAVPDDAVVTDTPKIAVTPESTGDATEIAAEIAVDTGDGAATEVVEAEPPVLGTEVTEAPSDDGGDAPAPDGGDTDADLSAAPDGSVDAETGDAPLPDDGTPGPAPSRDTAAPPSGGASAAARPTDAVAATRAPDPGPLVENPTVSASAPAGNAAAAPSAPASPSPTTVASTVQRIIEVVEEIARQTPPRSMTVELSELDGVRVQVSMESSGVRLRFLDDLGADQRRMLERELARSLAERGFDLADGRRDGRQTGHGREEPQWAPLESGRILRPVVASVGSAATTSDATGRGVRL